MTIAMALLVFLTHPSSAQSDQPTISVQLAIPATADGTPPRVQLTRAGSHFHVLLSSHSSSPQRVWDDVNSWGYYALSFELVDDSGAVSVIRRKAEGFMLNYPGWWALKPYGHVVRDVYLSDRIHWDGVPRAMPDCETVKMRAVFEVKPDVESERLKVWTGRVVSDIEPVRLCE